MRIALFEPDIPQNTGNIFRLSACLGIPVDIIEPTGFIFDDKKFKTEIDDLSFMYKYDELIQMNTYCNQIHLIITNSSSSPQQETHVRSHSPHTMLPIHLSGTPHRLFLYCCVSPE